MSVTETFNEALRKMDEQLATKARLTQAEKLLRQAATKLAEQSATLYAQAHKITSLESNLRAASESQEADLSERDTLREQVAALIVERDTEKARVNHYRAQFTEEVGEHLATRKEHYAAVANLAKIPQWIRRFFGAD